jgi:alpha-galactosidase
LAESRRWAAAHFEGTEPFFSFVYDGTSSAELLEKWELKRTQRELDPQRTEHTLLYADPKTGLEVRCVGIEYHDFPTVEWTLYFKNAGNTDTPILADIRALSTRFERNAEGEFLLHHSVGSPCQPNDYQPLETPLGPNATQRITAAGGRPTNSDLPYFNIQWPGQGVIAVVGWPGQWAADFARDEGCGLRICAGQETTHFKLLPGEEIRSPLVVLQFWKGDYLRSQNVWRRWFIAHNLPRPDGKPVPTHYAACFGNMQPRAEEELAIIDGFLREGIKLDYWILDAGWYPSHGQWSNTGTWEVDPERFPRGLRELADHLHAHGMKFVVWFEPERVMPGSWLDENHPEWLLPCKADANTTPQLGRSQARLLNLGNPEAWKWAVEHFDNLLVSQGIDVYRQDFNMDPLEHWRTADAPDRQGMTEMKHVLGYLAYWDELLRRHPGLWIDTCASGGRRNDLETLRRSVPLLRSDCFDTPTTQQSQTYGISLWIPYYGSGLGASDPYWFRSCIFPASRVGWDTRKKDLDYPLLHRMIDEFRRVESYLLGDYYPLTSYSLENNVWMAWQFDRTETGEGMVQAFRREKCVQDSIQLPLHGLDPNASYTLTNFDLPGTTEATGRELLDRGLAVTIAGQPGAAVITYKRK